MECRKLTVLKREKKMLAAALLFVVLAASAEGFCIARGPYYVAAKALAVGIGNITSHAVCKFTTAPGISLDGTCPDACMILIRVRRVQRLLFFFVLTRAKGYLGRLLLHCAVVRAGHRGLPVQRNDDQGEDSPPQRSECAH